MGFALVVLPALFGHEWSVGENGHRGQSGFGVLARCFGQPNPAIGIQLEFGCIDHRVGRLITEPYASTGASTQAMIILTFFTRLGTHARVHDDLKHVPDLKQILAYFSVRCPVAAPTE